MQIVPSGDVIGAEITGIDLARNLSEAEFATIEAAFNAHAVLSFRQQRLDERRHISGKELALACRDLALEKFGVMAALVLEHWGVHSSADLGDVVNDLLAISEEPNVRIFESKGLTCRLEKE